MRNTPQRTRSYASPTRDKIFIWSAVVAGCGIMALLGRHAAIHRFGTDQFTGNVLFAVFFVLSIGLYCGFQSGIEDVFNRLSTLFFADVKSWLLPRLPLANRLPYPL